MFIFVVNFKVKSGVTENDMIRLHDDVAAPIYSKTNGCKGTFLLKYSSLDNKAPEWDYAAIEVWESKEAQEKASNEANSYISQLNQKGFGDKFWSMLEKSTMSHAIPLATLIK